MNQTSKNGKKTTIGLKKASLFGKDLQKILPKLKAFYDANTKDVYADIYWRFGETTCFLSFLEEIATRMHQEPPGSMADRSNHDVHQ